MSSKLHFFIKSLSSKKLTPSTELTTCHELAKYTALLERDPEEVLNSSVKKKRQKLVNTFAYHTVSSIINFTPLYKYANIAVNTVNE